MRIVFSAGELDKELNANTKIVMQLARQMAAMGHTVAVAGICYYKPCEEMQAGVLIKKFPAPKPVTAASEAFEEFVGTAVRNQLRGEFVKKHPFKAVCLAARYNAVYIDKVEQPSYLRQLKKFVSEFKPDVMVLPYKPINSFETVAFSDISVPMAAYQMDPWGLHRIDNAPGDTEVIDKECAAFERVGHIFTTPVLLRQYSETEPYKKYTDKMTAVDFPNIKAGNTGNEQERMSDGGCESAKKCQSGCENAEKYPDESYGAKRRVGGCAGIEDFSLGGVRSAIDFDTDYINILFAGVVADSFRSPETVLKALEPLFAAGEKVRIYFVGTNNSKVLDGYLQKYPQNVFFADKVSAQTAQATMRQADILLNIGNALDNQVPSKIFDYFALGKPVLNQQQIENCPAAPYMERYPLAFTVKKDCNSAELAEFLHNSKCKTVDFARVCELYKTATVEYVAEKMLDEFEKMCR